MSSNRLSDGSPPIRYPATPTSVVLLHGATLDHHAWAPQLDALHDRFAGTAAWARREPLAEYAEIPRAGHASNLDNPGAFTAVLLAFLDRVLPPTNPPPRSGSRTRRSGRRPR